MIVLEIFAAPREIRADDVSFLATMRVASYRGADDTLDTLEIPHWMLEPYTGPR